MVNVANGNLLVQADDMAIPNKGIELAFRRTYNALSIHDVAGADGSPNVYSQKWTNTFDSHIAYNDFPIVNCQRGVTVFDVDGAHYDYSPVGDGINFNPPAGQFAVLYYQGGQYYWLKKTGTQYVYWDINQTTPNVGYSGQIRFIFGRNVNNSLTLQRTWNPDSTSLKNLSQMTVTTEDGHYATLTYGNVTGNGQTFRVLQTLKWPDQTTNVNYKYTIEASYLPGGYAPVLTEIDEPGNNVATTLAQQYAYGNTYALMTTAYSPRWVLKPLQIGDGPAYNFFYGSVGNITSVQYYGDVNPSISDGYSTGALQSNVTADFGYNTPYRTASLCYSNVGGGGGCTYLGGQTVWSDTDGHQTTYLWDSIGRETQGIETTGDPTSGQPTLTANQSWDASNNLISSTDARGNEIDYAYDNNGNIIAEALPAANAYINGSTVSIRRTSLYSYDSHNNIVAYCNPVEVHAAAKDWSTRPSPSDNLCSTANGLSQFTSFTFASTNSEPYGELTQITLPLGYHRTIAYNIAAESPSGSTDYGLATSVVGDQITQIDGSHVTPTESLYYDSSGNILCSNKGNGLWVLTYDSDGRQTAVADPDDASLLASAPCPSKSPGLPGSHIQTTTTYYADGNTKQVQGPSGYAAGTFTSYDYDADGNENDETHNYGGHAGTTTKWYDGDDRLVEVRPPHLSSDLDAYSFPWMTRYYYDLTQNSASGVTALGSSSFLAHGNLFKTQEFVKFPGQGSAQWNDMDGTGFDALDRGVTRFKYAPSDTATHQTSYAYDTTQPTYGLLATSKEVDLNITTTFSYDADGKQSQIQFSDGTPSLTYAYDPNDQIAYVQSSTLGAEYRTYDGDGRLSTVAEPTSSPITAPMNPLQYDYYGNGWKKDVQVTSSALTQTTTPLLTYAYRTDGYMINLTLNYSGTAYPFSYSFSPAGRLLSTGDYVYSSARNYSHDNYGRISSFSIPAGSYSSFTYDPEGEVTGYLAYNGPKTSYNSISVTNVFDSRAELSKRTYSHACDQVGANLNGRLTGLWQASANGLTDQYDMPPIGPACGSPSGFYNSADVRTKAITSGGSSQPQSTTTSYAFDAGGRQTSLTEHYFVAQPPLPPKLWTGSSSRQFDAENHLIAQQYSQWNFASGIYSNKSRTASAVDVAYQWGPNGHPILMGSSPWGSGGYQATPPPTSSITYKTLHWDGGSVLFTTKSDGTLDLIYVGSDATVSSSGISIQDRNLSGVMDTSHGGTASQPYNGADAWLPGHPYRTMPCTASLCEITMVGTDGYTDGLNTFQGVRAYDQEVGQWTAPDAYQGDVDDPISQLKYMYNRNNPVTYSDPSGFISNSNTSTDSNTHTDSNGFNTDVPGYMACTGNFDNDACRDFDTWNEGLYDKENELWNKYKDPLEAAATIDVPVLGEAKTASLIEDLTRSAGAIYPKKALKDELHHVIPKYLGGSAKGLVVKINAAYHQLITNAFRERWAYGRRLPSRDELQAIITSVYSRLPLP